MADKKADFYITIEGVNRAMKLFEQKLDKAWEALPAKLKTFEGSCRPVGLRELPEPDKRAKEDEED